MNWNDQAPVYAASPLVTFHTEGRSIEIEKVQPVFTGPWLYRVSVGNLFGSESVLCAEADDAFRTLAAILRELKKPETKRKRPAIPEAAQVEPRDWHTKEADR